MPGKLPFRDHDLSSADEDERTLFRREHIGFVFQFYNLIAGLTALENVALVAEIASNPLDPSEALQLVGLSERKRHYPAQLSGGEQQRIAIARAIGKRPDVLLLPTDPTLLDARSQAESEARVQAADAAQAESDAMLVSAQEAASLARDQYQRALKLHSGNSLSDAEFDEAEHHHRMTDAALRSAEFKSKVKRYEKELVQAALMRITDAKDDKNITAIKIASPIDGRILRILHEDSSVVTAGTPILEIGDPQDLEMKIDVLSTDAVAIETGAKVIVEHWGGDQPLHGTVRIVEPSAFLRVSALGVEEKRVNVIADFVESWEERKALGDGYRIEARIVTHSTDADSLKVASGTLIRHEEGWHVYRIRNHKAELVRVRVGATNGLETEILEGLVESDRVILHPTDQIRPGITVYQR